MHQVQNKKNKLPVGHYPSDALTNSQFSQLYDNRKVPEIAKMFCSGYRFELPCNTPEDLKSIFTDNVLVGEKRRKPMTGVNLMLEKAFDIPQGEGVFIKTTRSKASSIEDNVQFSGVALIE